MSDKPTRLSRIGHLLKRFMVLGGGLGVVASLVGAVAGGVLYKRHVLDEPGAHLDRQHIRSIIAQESPVYYRDGETRIGVFFSDEHRQYVPFDELPAEYVVAIVAAEDGAFWSHQGVNPKGIARAMVDNVKAGGLVAGGSTLTQQTAKNLYYRPDRTLRSKGIELVNALRLEAHFDKSEILTFYANQFHVSGNGRGLGIAARYFFDADVSELSLAQSAYLAGLVKGPSNYDPFLGDEDRRTRAHQRAHDRTRYVLRRIVEEPAENLAGERPGRGDSEAMAAYEARLAEVQKTQMEALKLLEGDIELPFRRGTFRYDSNAVLDEVGRRLGEAPFDQVLTKAGIDDPATAGLKIVTTLDPGAQQEATYALWHHLTEVGTMLEVHGPSDFIRTDVSGPRHDPDRLPVAHEFRIAEVTKLRTEGGKKHLMLDLGGHECVADRDAMVRAAVAVWRGEKGSRSARAPGSFVDGFVDQIPVGSAVWVSVREVPESGAARCDLELRPELQGASMALQDGRIRAMVGGNDNRNFNRSTALRQMGSTWKPLIFHAALQLGWEPTDELDNSRNVFPYSTTFYYPRPDHTPADVVSMSWAGVNSENLASIWLLYHLTEKLNLEQVRGLAADLDLAKREGESDKAYATRIQEAGVLPTRSRVDEGLFLQAKAEALSGLALDGHPEDALALTSLLYGWNYDDELVRVDRAGGRGADVKRAALAWNYRDVQSRVDSCKAQHILLSKAVQRGKAPDPVFVADLSAKVTGDQTLLACGAVPEGYLPIGEVFTAEDEVLTTRTIGTVSKPVRVPLGPPRRGVGGTKGIDVQVPDVGDVLIDGRIHLSTLEAVDSGLRRRRLARRAAGSAAPGLYAPEVLYWHQDFRILLALRYVEELARQYGVRTELQPVLSLPLGASEITLEEATSVYQGLITGHAWDLKGRAGTGPLARDVAEAPAPGLLIERILDVDGNVLYEAAPEARQVAVPEVGAMTADILENVVIYGTGRRAKGAVKIDGQTVPVGGKTGTTNEFRNSAFLGFVPNGGSTGFSTTGGYTLGVYVGYDDNRPMEQGRIRIAGSSGALPAWIGLARGLASRGLLDEPAWDAGEKGFAVEYPAGLVEVAVDPDQGLALAGEGPADGSTVLARKSSAPAAPVHLDARPRPIRIAPRTEEIVEALKERRRLRREAAGKRPSIWDGGR
ncbi:MAG: transglycosylase domain-containing protein [Proteobacteria bacterium]|nr:transglycosylase domain-containing protein [Pseudomonadota bacterium]